MLPKKQIKVFIKKNDLKKILLKFDLIIFLIKKCFLNSSQRKYNNNDKNNRWKSKNNLIYSEKLVRKTFKTNKKALLFLDFNYF